jgi:type VI secretion system ImpB/VipA family protein
MVKIPVFTQGLPGDIWKVKVMESIQHKLDRVRSPRVQITYDVEVGNAIVMKELPFVMGIMADLAGHPAESPVPLKKRKFIEIDRDNFNDIMEKIRPRLTLRVDNKLEPQSISGDGPEGQQEHHLSAELFFHSMDNFQPLSVVKQIDPLRLLYESRTKLKDMLTKLDGNDELDELLYEVLTKSEQRDGLKSELASQKVASAEPSADQPAR